jgi:HAD superfamily hydrolase (TIGR01509 family)
MTQPEPRRALILDFDGVLVDTEPLHFESWNQAFAELFGIRLEGGHQVLVGLTLEEIYQLWWQAGKTPASALTVEMKDRLLRRKTELFFALGKGRLLPMPGGVELLERARSQGWYTAIVSRSLRLRLHRTLDLLRLPTHFDVILGSEDAVNPRTNRKDHARAASIFGINPAVCVVVEDSPSGVADARTAGIGRVIGLTTSLNAAVLQAAGAHEVVDHLDTVQL